MSANHLIIGLGGTGAEIIRSFRKTIFQEFRKENPDGANLAYLYVSKNPLTFPRLWWQNCWSSYSPGGSQLGPLDQCRL